jgi:flagellar motor switch protein FliG
MTTKTDAQGIRKAAIFVASLDQRAADAVLDHMTPDQARLIRDMLFTLDRIDPAEEQGILEEFGRLTPSYHPKPPDGIELEGSLASQIGWPPAPHIDISGNAQTKAPAFQFLRDAETDKLIKLLVAERPQVIALVLAHLPPAQAGKFLVRLPVPLQMDVVRRLVDLEETDPEILREVERGLETRLSEQVRMQRRRVAGVSAITGILQASDRQIGMKLYDTISACDRKLAERISPEQFDFPDLMRLPTPALGRIIASTDRELIVLALVGAPPEWIGRFLQHFPPQDANAIRYRLDHFGPVRLRDVEEARTQLAETSRRLAIAGQIELPGATKPKG